MPTKANSEKRKKQNINTHTRGRNLKIRSMQIRMTKYAVRILNVMQPRTVFISKKTEPLIFVSF